MRNALVRIIFLPTVACTFLCQGAMAQGAFSEPLLAKVKNEIANHIDSATESTYNGSLLVAKRGEAIVVQHYGWTNVERTTRIDLLSRFNVGSLAKEIPAVAVLDLMLAGHLSYEDPVGRFIPELPEWSKEVTISDLLFYTSGLPYVNFRMVRNDQEAMNQIKELNPKPRDVGFAYFYSNWNNFLLAKVVEAVTQVDFRTWVQENYFSRLGINDSFYDATSPNETLHMTRSFTEKMGDDEAGNPNFKRFELCYAPLYMTIEDVSKWIEFVGRRYEAEGDGVQRFYRPTSLERQGPLGVIRQEDGKAVVHQHGGYAYSYGCSTYRDYTSELTVILMTNKHEGIDLSALTKGILAVLEANGIN